MFLLSHVAHQFKNVHPSCCYISAKLCIGCGFVVSVLTSDLLYISCCYIQSPFHSCSNRFYKHADVMSIFKCLCDAYIFYARIVYEYK